jgi:hypothetical protein
LGIATNTIVSAQQTIADLPVSLPGMKRMPAEISCSHANAVRFCFIRAAFEAARVSPMLHLSGPPSAIRF